MQFVDAVAVTGVRKTSEGYLVADARTARTGIQVYLGSEVDKADMATVRVYRPEDEVFKADSLKSFSHIPVTNDHPAEAVTADNWKSVAVGETGEEVLRDGQRLRIPLVVKDKAAIADVEAGKRELSVGYSCQLDWSPGTTPWGEVYDAIQRNITANHVAIVHRGRAGSECRIGDSAGNWGAAPLIDHHLKKDKIMTLKTVTVDGIPVEVTDQGATVIATLLQRLADANTKTTGVETAHQSALAAKDAEIAKRDAQIDDLKGKVLSDADLDKRVQDRAELVSVAKAIAKDVKTEGLSDAAIRKAVVVAKLGDAAIVGKTDAYVDARFDILADEAKASGADPVRAALLNRDHNPTTTTDNGQAAYEKRLTDAWKGA